MEIKTKLVDQNVLVSVAFLLIVPAVAHLLLSWRGFSPTDDGFTLAYSRRILEGQIPHRDFIIIRPFVSPLIHTPVVLFGGDYTYWVSRFFVWFEFACTSWAWLFVDRHCLSVQAELLVHGTFVRTAFGRLAREKVLADYNATCGCLRCLSAGYRLVLRSYPTTVFADGHSICWCR